MSAHKIKYKYKVILDLTDKKLDYDKVYSRLKKIRIVGSYMDEDQPIFLRSGIKVGKYVVFVNSFTPKKFAGRDVSIKYLSMNDSLRVDILEERGDEFKSMKSNLLEDEPWFRNYLKSSFSIRELTDVVLFCNRLESLTSFS
jgi:hypothetical protein